MAQVHGSRLTSIPPEVLLQITSSLPTPDYGNLRLACKHVEATLFSSFSREFFTKRQFAFTEFSLQALIDISKSRLSPCLKHIIFGLDRPIQPLTPTSAPTASGSHDSAIKYNRATQAAIAHLILLNTGQDVEMIKEALSNLKNVEALGMRDFYSRSRHRDYPNNEWKSYGASTHKEQTGHQLEMPRRYGAPDQANYINRTFLNILLAAGKSASPIKTFEVILRTSSLSDPTFYFPKFVEPIIRPVLTNLDTLFLELNLGFPPTYVAIDGVPSECPSYFTSHFISNLSLLKHLRLNFNFGPTQTITDFLSWIGKPAPNTTATTTVLAQSLPEFPRPVGLNLRRLDFGMLTVKPQILLSIIKKCRTTLRTISFHKVALLEDISVKPKDKVNLWLDLFEGISALDVNLTSINLTYLNQAHPSNPRSRAIYFNESSNQNGMRWAGPDAQKGLKRIIECMNVKNMNVESDDSDGSDDDDNDSDAMMIDADVSDEDDDDDADNDD